MTDGQTDGPTDGHPLIEIRERILKRDIDQWPSIVCDYDFIPTPTWILQKSSTDLLVDTRARSTHSSSPCPRPWATWKALWSHPFPSVSLGARRSELANQQAQTRLCHRILKRQYFFSSDQFGEISLCVETGRWKMDGGKWTSTALFLFFFLFFFFTRF